MAIVSTLSRQLQAYYGRGFSAKSLRHMIRFAEVFPDEATVFTVWRQLSWSHFKEIIYQKGELQRDFYAEMCRVERGSVRTLIHVASYLTELPPRNLLQKKLKVTIAAVKLRPEHGSIGDETEKS